MTILPMADPPRLLLAWGALALGALGAAFRSVADPGLDAVLYGLMFVAFPVVGVVLRLRIPENPIGSILLAVGAVGGVEGVSAGLASVTPPDSLVAGAAHWMLSWSFYPIIGLVSVPLLLLFPTGRMLSPGWRWAIWTVPLFVVTASVGVAFSPWSGEQGRANPLAVDGSAEIFLFLLDISGLPLLVGVLAGVASLAVRYRRATDIERQQIKWFLAAAALLPIAIGIGDEYREIQGTVVPIAFILFPLAIGVAVTRYRLYDIDRIVSRTVTYAAVTALLVGAYLSVVFALRRLLPAQDDLAVVASTLAVAALFNPIRRRIQGVVDRRFNRSRYDVERTIDEFGERLRTEGSLFTLADELTIVAGVTMQPQTVSLWLRDEERP